MIAGRALSRLLFFGLDLGFLLFESHFCRLDVALQRLRLSHQLENTVLGAADFGVAIVNFVLKRTVLVVSFGLEHLIFEFRDLLLLDLDFAFEPLAVLLIGGQRRAVCLELALMGIQFFLDFRNMLGKRGNFSCQFGDPVINFL